MMQDDISLGRTPIEPFPQRAGTQYPGAGSMNTSTLQDREPARQRRQGMAEG